MRAAVVRDGRLEVEERPDPVPGEDELLIQMRAAGVNGADLAQRAGHYPPPPGTPPDVPGLECAGETDDRRRVMALLPGAGHAELVAAHRDLVLDIPDNVSWEEAGGFVEVFATAHDALFTQAELQRGERLLVNGAAGGVGTAAVQLGVAAGAHVTASARHHLDELRALGADTQPSGEYDVILELVGGPNMSTNLDRLATKGRIAVIGAGAGSRAEIDFSRLMRTRGRIMSSNLRFRSIEEKADVIRRLKDDVVPLLARGDISVILHAALPLAEAQEIYDRFAAGGKFGKLVIVP